MKICRKYTFVTVAHQLDYEALCFQARSLAKYLSKIIAYEIIIVDNGITGSHEHLLKQYGRLRSIVRVVNGKDIAPEYVFKKSGWFTQQVLKLMVCNFVKTDRYVVLDSKNTMVFPLQRSFLETILGKPKTHKTDFTKHGSKRWLKNTLKFFNLSESHIKSYMPITTPYIFVVNLVKDMFVYVERREGKPFPQVFLDKELTEFYFYAGYLIHIKDDTYDFSGQECKCIFDTTSEFRFVKTFLVATETKKLPFFAVHRNAKISPGSRRAINGFWYRRGLS